MKEQEQAKELVERFKSVSSDKREEYAIQCAIIHCEGMIKEFSATHIGYGKGIMNAYYAAKTKKWQSVLTQLKQM